MRWLRVFSVLVDQVHYSSPSSYRRLMLSPMGLFDEAHTRGKTSLGFSNLYLINMYRSNDHDHSSHITSSPSSLFEEEKILPASLKYLHALHVELCEILTLKQFMPHHHHLPWSPPPPTIPPCHSSRRLSPHIQQHIINVPQTTHLPTTTHARIRKHTTHTAHSILVIHNIHNIHERPDRFPFSLRGCPTT